MPKRLAAAIVCAIAAQALTVFAAAPALAETLRPHTVAELFTSQGCSSCPPADRLWNELAVRDDVLALSLPVDYWDYLGWKDTFARPEHTARQRAYARALRARSVYTPQGIINGSIDVIGSRRQDVLDAIGANPLGVDVPVEITRTGDAVAVRLGASARHTHAARVWLVLYRPHARAAIARGENAGRTISYANVVESMSPLGTWRGKAASYTAPVAAHAGSGLLCAVLVQRERDGNPGAITAAGILAEPL